MNETLLYSSPGLPGLLKSLAITSNLNCALYDENGMLVEAVRTQGELSEFLWSKMQNNDRGLAEFESKILEDVLTNDQKVEASFLNRLDVIAHPLHLFGDRKGVIVLGYVMTHFPSPEDCKVLAKEFDLTYLQVWHHARKDSPSTKEKLNKFSFLFRDILESHLAGVFGSLQLQAADLMKDEFLSVVSHELKTPLTAALLRLQVLSRKMEANGFQGEVEQLKHAVNSLRGQEIIINDLLDVSRVSQGKLRFEIEVASVNDLAERCSNDIRPMIEDKGINFKFTPLDTDQKIRMDTLRIRQVILNLLNNALKFTTEGEIHFMVRSMNERVQFMVIDTGIGLEKDELTRVFNKFMQAASNQSYKGLGLGLFLAEQIIRSHNGRIYALSEGKGQGATFVAEIPLADIGLS